MTARSVGAAAMTAALFAATPVMAQVTAGVEATTDERRRGLSWSGGDASVSGDVRATLGAIDAGVRVAALRGSARHGGADAVADLDVGTGWDLGAVRANARLVAHLFSGAEPKADYGEVAGDLSYSLGPAQVVAGVAWAPQQRALGGSNLYLYASGNVGVPGTPLTVIGGIGRSTGTVNDPSRAVRLRPGGDYTDWQLGVEHVAGLVILTLQYVGTDVGQRDVTFPLADARNSGDRIVGRARLSF